MFQKSTNSVPPCAVYFTSSLCPSLRTTSFLLSPIPTFATRLSASGLSQKVYIKALLWRTLDGWMWRGFAGAGGKRERRTQCGGQSSETPVQSRRSQLSRSAAMRCWLTIYQIQVGDHGPARTLYLLLVHLRLLSVSCIANRARTAPVWHTRRLRISLRGSTSDSGTSTLHPPRPLRDLSMSSARGHLPCSAPSRARSRTQSLRCLSSRLTFFVIQQRAMRQCQTSALFPSRGGQLAQKRRAQRL
jgi:hypothetical protein